VVRMTWNGRGIDDTEPVPISPTLDLPRRRTFRLKPTSVNYKYYPAVGTCREANRYKAVRRLDPHIRGLSRMFTTTATVGLHVGRYTPVLLLGWEQTASSG